MLLFINEFLRVNKQGDWRFNVVRSSYKINILLVSNNILLQFFSQPGKLLYYANYLQTAKMFIKLTLICLAFVPLIIGKASENPSESETRAGKSFGWLSGKKWHLWERIRSEIPNCWLNFYWAMCVFCYLRGGKFRFGVSFTSYKTERSRNRRFFRSGRIYWTISWA